MSNIVFYSHNFEGKSKTSGKPYYAVTLTEYNHDTGRTSVHTLFSQARLDNLGEFIVGDLVKPIFAEASFIGGKPYFIGLEKVAPSPFFDTATYAVALSKIAVLEKSKTLEPSQSMTATAAGGGGTFTIN